MSEHCSQCGDAIAAEEWHPVATERGDDGTVEIRYFCSEKCRSAWQGGDGASIEGEKSPTAEADASTGETDAPTNETDASTDETDA